MTTETRGRGTGIAGWGRESTAAAQRGRSNNKGRRYLGSPPRNPQVRRPSPPLSWVLPIVRFNRLSCPDRQLSRANATSVLKFFLSRFSDAFCPSDSATGAVAGGGRGGAAAALGARAVPARTG